MKKIFTVILFLMALTLVAGPSYALKGIDDAVPGTDFIVPFIVEIGATGLDTNILIQEISDAAGLGGTEATAAGQIHWFINASNSAELKDRIIRYSGGDVVPLSMRALIAANCTAADLTAMEFDLNGDGTNDTYVGYLYGLNLSTAVATDNLVVYFQYVDLAAGRASGAFAAMREWTGIPTGNNTNNALGYRYEQFASANAAGAGTVVVPFIFQPAPNTTGATRLPQVGSTETFTPAAYFWSSERERGQLNAAILGNAANLNFMRFVPRFYLHNANGESFIILWKNRNHAAPLNNRVNIYMWNATETRISGWLTLPLELNIIRVRDILPPDFLAAYPSGGWIDIAVADAGVPFVSGFLENWRYTEFLMWTWMYAADTAASLNWASLWTDRQVGTLGALPRGSGD